MNDTLTFSEKRYINKFLEESKSIDSSKWPEWVSMTLIGFGGLILVITCLAALNNLSAQNIEKLFYLGLFAGGSLLVVGVIGSYLAKRVEEKMIMRSVLKKLLA